VKILLVNWNDRANPLAGGAEVHLHAIFGRLAGAGHGVDLVASGWPGASPTAEIDGIRVRRVGGRQSFAWRARRAVRAALGAGEYDVVVEDVEAEARRLVERIASLAPLAVAGSKRLLDAAGREALERALDREAVLCQQLFETADAREGLAAFLEKREPRFRGS